MSCAPPWAARRGAKHAVLQYWKLPALPPPKGVMLVKFCWAAGGMFPRNCSIAPSKGGDVGNFSFGPPGACTRATAASPPAKGRMLSVFLHPLLGRCKAEFCAWHLASVFWLRGRFEFETFWTLSSKTFEFKSASTPQRLRGLLIPPHTAHMKKT